MSVAGALTGPAASAATDAANKVSDGAVLNFALNLEYLEAEFYSNAVHGHGIPESLTHGNGRRGAVEGGRKVSFGSKKVREIAQEIARDEPDHVAFLRAALGSAAVARPTINNTQELHRRGDRGRADQGRPDLRRVRREDNFLLGAFIFEDVGVTAYKGAAPLISNKTYLSAAAGILAVEAYHASTVRTMLYDRGLSKDTDAISAARNSLDGPRNDDRGTTRHGRANIVPTDSHGLAFGRTTGRVLNIVYLTPKKATSGGFFPHGVNGTINTSS
jgi:hypothetical protein